MTFFGRGDVLLFSSHAGERFVSVVINTQKTIQKYITERNGQQNNIVNEQATQARDKAAKPLAPVKAETSFQSHQKL